ncbi:MAG TPA: RNB domain-containing ribonuclease [Gemmatimonadaceae bacterium]|nr:RNB domain-containing ribonuclease [Gemmatimonadaceae bacterium]
MTPPFDLRAFADRAMRENGFLPEVPADVAAEVARISDDPAGSSGDGDARRVRDLRHLPWSSIDNDTSRDLDQLEVVDRADDGNGGGGGVRVRVAIADVDTTVHQGSATDRFAAANATSVYTGAATYPMLPERLSTDVTSLGQDASRASVVIEFVVGGDGAIRSHDVYLALVENHAKLAYDDVGAWLEGHPGAALPPAVTPEIEAQLRLQDAVAQSLRAVRARAGALDLETAEAHSVVRADGSVDVEAVRKTRANALIEDFMIAANVAMAQFLDERGSPSIRRVVRTPERWNRIVALAAAVGETLPPAPDSGALAAFLERRHAADPEHFPDLSLAVVKLLGPGEYALHHPGGAAGDDGHFGLAAPDYTHATAPNRRFADLVTQRLLKAVLAGRPVPYADDELAGIARHCTEREDAARKVERTVRKAAAAVAMATHVGQTFGAIVTGVTPKGTFVRLLGPPVEGRVVRGEHGLDVGDKVRVTLLATDPARGYVDFGVG